jgi:hypothetical protein
LQRNLGKSGNPFQFEQTRQALQASKQQVKTENDQYMQNAVAPYQYGAQQTQAVQNWARGLDKTAQPDWMQTFQQGTPKSMDPFQSQAKTEFAPVRAMQTNAGVRAYLRDPSDPESRSGEQAVDYSILNADPNFNLNREATLKDYADLLKTKGDIEANAGAEARRAQLDAFNKFKAGISGTLDTEAQAILNAAKAEEEAYDKGFGNVEAMKRDVLTEEMRDLAASAPENLRSYFFNPTGLESEVAQYFNPATAEATRAEDFLSGEGASNFNRIMAALGRGGNIATAGRLAGKQGPGRESLGFNRQGFRDEMFNRAIAQANRPNPFGSSNAYSPPPPMPEPAPAPIDWGVIMPGVANIQLPPELYNQGGRVPGQAREMGDSPANDVVSAKLSPGEIVIPRSSAMDKESAKKFIDNMPFSKTRELLKNKYACGGKVQDQYNCGGMVKANYKKGGR